MAVCQPSADPCRRRRWRERQAKATKGITAVRERASHPRRRPQPYPRDRYCRERTGISRYKMRKAMPSCGCRNSRGGADKLGYTQFPPWQHGWKSITAFRPTGENTTTNADVIIARFDCIAQSTMQRDDGSVFHSRKWKFPPSASFIRNVQNMAACLAVDGIGFVPLQAALGAGENNLVRAHDRLCQPHKQRDAEDHRDDRRQFA